MSGWQQHLIIAPIVIPLVVGALLLFFDESERVLKTSTDKLHGSDLADRQRTDIAGIRRQSRAPT